MAKVKLKMLTTQKGSEDGFTTRVFQKGKRYSVGEDLAKVFIDNEWAEGSMPEKAEQPAPATGDAGDGTEGDADKEDARAGGEDGTRQPTLEDKPGQWIGLVLLNEDQQERTVASTKGNQVFFQEEPEVPYDYRLIRKNYVIKE